jgi:ABC-type cobalamin/Fe3+-siderophores transport system ATPase subunit
MGTSHMSLLRATGLAVGFGGQPLIEGVDLHLNAGECVALIGLNGAGKSTLVNSLAGLHDPMAGRVEVEGRPLTELSANERAKRIAMVLTGRPQVGLLDVRTLVALGRQPWTGHFGRLAAKDLPPCGSRRVATQ